MSDFQDGFFQDLWYDTLLNGPRSLLCGYFREEKRRHDLVLAKKAEYERRAVYGPRGADGYAAERMSGHAAERTGGHAAERTGGHAADGWENPPAPGTRQGAAERTGERTSDDAEDPPAPGTRQDAAEKTDERASDGRLSQDAAPRNAVESGKRARKSTDGHACVEILCGYYELCARQTADTAAGKSRARELDYSLAELDSFLTELEQKADEAKCSKKRKVAASEAIQTARKRLRTQKRLRTVLDDAVMRVADLYLYAEAAQFLYNAGYPLPPEDKDEKYGKEVKAPQKKDRARIKTIPLKLLDYYFERRGLSMNEMTSVTRMQPSRIARNEDQKEKLEEVYDFACENEMDRAVIPLLIDNASGSGLYVLGRNYLKSWETSEPLAAEVEEILAGKPCCYAIVKFLNLELEDGGEYFWAPYSVTDPVYGKGNINPRSVLFGDLETALNIYQGQLNATSMEVLYENFRSENIVNLPESEILIDPQFRKYFQTEPYDLADDLAELQNEYQKKLKKWEGFR